MSSSPAVRCSPGFAVRLVTAWDPGVDRVPDVVRAIAAAGGELVGCAPLDAAAPPGHAPKAVRAWQVNAPHLAGQRAVADALRALAGVDVVADVDMVHHLHDGGKLAIRGKAALDGADDLARAYTPGVARVCQTLHTDPAAAFRLTQRRNTVAVVSDGSAILGLGNLGPVAALPVMEGKAQLFKEFGHVDAFPLCVPLSGVDAIVDFCVAAAPVFGGINLEDIAAPRCFEIEEKLQARVDIPVFHDDQHGTAIVAVAALENALAIVGKRWADLKVVIAGVGAAGTACARLFMAAGAADVVGVDRTGVLYRGRPDGMNPAKEALAAATNPRGVRGTLADALRGADVFVGVSGPNIVTVDDVKAMAPRPIVFAMSNPDPEIAPERAGPHVAVMATGRSDYPNQINNVLAFPGLFRGALDVRAARVTPGMKLAAARAIAGRVDAAARARGQIVPSPFDRETPRAVAAAVREAARADGVAPELGPLPGVDFPAPF